MTVELSRLVDWKDELSGFGWESLEVKGTIVIKVVKDFAPSRTHTCTRLLMLSPVTGSGRSFTKCRPTPSAVACSSRPPRSTSSLPFPSANQTGEIGFVRSHREHALTRQGDENWARFAP